jgi:hypothetical protein
VAGPSVCIGGDFDRVGGIAAARVAQVRTHAAPVAPTLLTPVDNPTADPLVGGSTCNLRPWLSWAVPADDEGDPVQFLVGCDLADGLTETWTSAEAVSRSSFQLRRGGAWIPFPAGGATTFDAGSTVSFRRPAAFAGSGIVHWQVTAVADGSSASASRRFLVVAPAWTAGAAAGAAIRAQHQSELRTASTLLRLLRGLAPIAWTDDPLLPGITPVRAVHLTELRAALVPARDAVGAGVTLAADPIVAGQTPVSAAHLAELRLALEGL